MSDYIFNNYPNDNNFSNNQKPNKGSGKTVFIALFCAASILVSGFLGIMIGVAFAPDTGKDTNGGTVNSYVYESPSIQNTGSVFEPEQLQNGGYLTVAQTAAYSAPTVVEIRTEYMAQSYFQYVTGGAGSGVISGEYKVNGAKAGYYILTNAHVIQKENGNIVDASGITVTTSDGKDYTVKNIVGYDTMGDVAVLMIETGDTLKCASFGDSDTLIVGQEVVAIGNPLGELGGTVTNGIVSSLDREINVDGNKMNLLQTNAAINPGNSGGGLFNLRGELVGLVNAKSSGSGIEGLGFAIPSNDVKRMLTDILTYGYVRGRPFVGINVYLDSYSRVRVHSLAPDHNDGVLQQHDIILSADGINIKSSADLLSVVQSHEVGETIDLKIVRNGKESTVKITVFEKKPS